MFKEGLALCSGSGRQERLADGIMLVKRSVFALTEKNGIKGTIYVNLSEFNHHKLS